MLFRSYGGIDDREGYIINPVLETGEETQEGGEGCLSVPGIKSETPGDPYRNVFINASNSSSAHASDRSHGRCSHSDDRLVRDMALLAVGLHTSHAVRHRGRGRVRTRFLLP